MNARASVDLSPGSSLNLGAPGKVNRTYTAVAAPTHADRTMECTECRAGLLYLTPKTGVQRIVALVLFRPKMVWRCHACGRTLADS